jgi:N-acetylmuramoyl-L-alanine amidase
VNLPALCRIEKGVAWLPLPLLNEILGHFIEINVEIKGRKLVSHATRFRMRKIIIDPGHGGKDPGAVGRNGLYEKDVVLAISKLTAELLESELGITCVLTRDSDVFIPLGRRARIANKHKADLFLSIHCNACKKRDRSGTEIYFMSQAKTNWARAVAARENASVKYETEEERGEVESILWDLAQTEFLKESNVLSGRLLECLIAAIGSTSRGVKQANFYVLRGVYMPACLVEVEFISHPKWEKKLKRKDFQIKAAKGIVEGVREFRDWFEGLER